jgi:N-acylneuraminate cytidylyltransferase
MKGYSERVPKKNMRNFCGRPLFHWILETLEKSRYFNEIIINTDSEEIAESAIKNFSVTIHMRSEYLKKITSNEANEIIEYELSQSDGEFFLQTHSTNPLLLTSTIDRSIETFFSQTEHDSLFSVTPIKARLFFANGEPINHDPHKLIKTQDLEPVYQENSCIYIFSKNSFFKNKNRIGNNPLMFPIANFKESIDIDTLDDFMLAEYFMKMDKKL